MAESLWTIKISWKSLLFYVIIKTNVDIAQVYQENENIALYVKKDADA